MSKKEAKPDYSNLYLFALGILVILGLDLLYQIYLMHVYELTFTTFVLTMFSRAFGALGPLVITGAVIYLIYGIVRGLIGITLARYISEEFSVLLSVLTAGGFLYAAILHEYSQALSTYVLILIGIYAVTFVLGVLARKYRPLVRTIGIISAFVYVIYHYAMYKTGLRIGSAFVYAFFVTGTLPLIVTVGKCMEESVRKRIKRPVLFYHALAFFFIGMFFLVEFFFVLLDAVFVASLYGASSIGIGGVILALLTIVSSSVVLTAGDTLVVAAVVNPSAVSDALSISFNMGLLFGPKRAIVYLKVVLAVVIVVLSIVAASKEKDEEKSKRKISEGLEEAAYVFSLDDILYLFYPYIAAIWVYEKDYESKMAAAMVVLSDAFLLLAFALLSSLYTVVLSLTVSFIGGVALYYVVHIAFPVQLTIYDAIIMGLSLFPVVYGVMGPISAAAKGEFMKDLIEKRKDEIERIKKVQKELKKEKEKEEVEAKMEKIEMLEKGAREIMKPTSEEIRSFMKDLIEMSKSVDVSPSRFGLGTRRSIEIIEAKSKKKKSSRVFSCPCSFSMRTERYIYIRIRSKRILRPSGRTMRRSGRRLRLRLGR